MHMADALISPLVGGSLWVATAGVGTYSVNKVKSVLDEKKIPLMGVMGAFIFAAQMINFSIPGTGSSGHLGGGLLLAILLGPYAGFLTMASILTIQALFFADGGLLALGCNIINLGFYTCFVAYPLIYKPITSGKTTPKRIFVASMIASILGLQMGSFSVVLETFLSGMSDLSLSSLLVVMQSIHLAIGVVEGLVVSAVVTYVWRTRPEIVDQTVYEKLSGSQTYRKVVVVFLILTVLVGGILSWFASSNPDGLEWSMLKVTGTEHYETTSSVEAKTQNIQDKTALLPDYNFKETNTGASENAGDGTSSKFGTSVSGLVGGTITLVLVGLIGLGINKLKKKHNSSSLSYK
ncbi:MAG: energy-coupling factor ABC transporter permease [Vallitaleaceae bacterium]|nr:energy-coupling factor ABC transporter permease [Vallitaleaceae bacterium]